MFPCLEELLVSNCPLLESVPLTGQCLSLKKLCIEDCSRLSSIGDGLATSTVLEELTIVKCGDLFSIPNLNGFSALRSIYVSDCGSLGIVPIAGICSSLKEFCISKCNGLSKIGEGLSTSICLEELKLSDCAKLSFIPDLEEFSSLRILDISDCHKLETITIRGRCPSLEKLHISSCPKLSKIGDWLSTSTSLEELKLGGCANLSSIPDLVGFFSLRILDILDCHELETVPIRGRYTSLKKLHVSLCPKLSKIGDGLSTSTSLEELKLSGCSNLSFIPDLEGFSSLRILDILDCHELETVPIEGRCSSLEKLHVSSCPKLSKIGDGLSTSTILEELKLSGCSNLSSIPDLEGFSSLQILDISDCHELKTVPIRGRCSSLEKLHVSSCPKLSKIGDGLSTSTILEELKLSGCSNLSSIPDLEGFSSLQILDISDCHELEIVPIRGRCSSLEKLHVSSCPKLSKIGDGLSTSTILEELKLSGCANLSFIPDLEEISSLRILDISDCHELKIVPIRGRCSSLEKLHVSSCSKLSKIGDGLSTSTSLEELKLSGCSNLSSIPDLLYIFSCPKLSKIGDWLSTSTSLEKVKLIGCANLSSIPDLEGFSSLRILDISNCHELKTVLIRGRCPSLEKLLISWCPKLSKIGDGLSTATCLKKLKLSHCGNLNSIPDLVGFSSLHILNISNCNNLEIVRITGRNATLQKLEIIACKKLRQIGDALLTFTFLRKLRIVNCPNLGPIPRVHNAYLTELDFTGVGEGLTRLLPDLLQPNDFLHNLTLSDLPDLRSIPESLGDMCFLDHLTIKRCPTLRSIPIDLLGRLDFLRRLDIGGFSEELEEFPGMDSIQHLRLQELRLLGWEKLRSLPYQLLHLTALEELEIQRFHGIEALPDWLGNLSYLKCLRIVSCDKLMYLPSERVMRSLSKLTTFIISECPRLEARCSKESGPEWSKISHICRISIMCKRLWFSNLSEPLRITTYKALVTSVSYGTTIHVPFLPKSAVLDNISRTCSLQPAYLPLYLRSLSVFQKASTIILLMEALRIATRYGTNLVTCFSKSVVLDKHIICLFIISCCFTTILFLSLAFCILAGKVSPCREVVLLKIIEEVSCKNLRYKRSSHATSPNCFSYLSEASRIVSKVSRDIRPEFSSVPESHSCFAPEGSTYNCHPFMELTLATKSPVLDNILGSKLEGLSHDRRGPAPDLIGKAIHKGKGARICVSS
ncbi:putative disease resistance protein At4g19050 [Gossypium raimondii]|uniref:putative disease resistance protein At4g19050 n=1 Tax=Gossypium raimondii TaxID=29730 RepID=UPI00227D280E|nr:putative disease resistance protein At4g19050 [Gossypium raimondii]